MAAPTQEYPPWLTPVPSVIFDANGVPIATSTTVLYLPLTYYGPSIPLNPDWTYGGLTPPASTSTLAPTISTPLTTPTSTAIPTTISSSITSATPPSSISASSSSSTEITSSLSSTFTSIPTSSPSSTQTSLPPPNPSSGLSRGQLVGVIVASILGFIFLLVLILAIYLFCKGRTRRRTRAAGTPIDDDYLIVSSGGRLPGEGSPRHSGEEADPFLQPRGGGTAAGSEKGRSAGGYTEVGARPPAPPPKNVSRVPAPPVASMSSSNSSSSNSGYGEPLAQPTLGIRPIREEHEQEMSGGRVLSPSEMRRVGRESVLPPSDVEDDNDQGYTGAYAYADTPLLPPPRLVDPAKRSSSEFTPPIPPFTKHGSLTSHRSSLPADADEKATLLTARRVKVEDLAPRVTPGSSPATDYAETSRASSSGTGLLGSIGLGAFAQRLSWFKGEASPRTSHHPSEASLEQGRPGALPRMREAVGSRGSASIGLGPDGTRPISSVSGKSGKSQNSGGTIYHDAASSLPGTPKLSPLRRTVTPPDARPPMMTAGASWQSQSQSRVEQSQQARAGTSTPSPYEQHVMNSPSGTSYARTLVPGFDILDMPAPSAMPSFNSSLSPSTSNTLVSRPSTGGIRTYPLPPGLETIPTPKVWSDASWGHTPSPGSFGAGQENAVTIAIDVLEEEPPTAGEGWRSMAAAVASGVGAGGDRFSRRATFGTPQYIHQPDHTSEQCSLHSVKSHLRPASPRSTGSAAVSGRDGSFGSGSSRPSRHSAGLSARESGASGMSLARSGSIISDGRGRPYGSISPSLSAFGPQLLHGAHDHGSREGSGSGSGEGVVVVLQSPSHAYLPLSPLGMPWAGGLDDEWRPS